MNYEIVIAGFGGQGVLFLGKLLAFAAMYSDYEVSWMPSYGPEMRGGTANCTVIISDEEIGSPIIQQPDILVAMNNPSYQRFEDLLKSGGTTIVNSSLVQVTASRDDIEIVNVPATELAIQNNVGKAANLVLAGELFKKIGFIKEEAIEKALKHCTPANKPGVFESNLKAMKLGYE